jgi:hypothetical protein
MSLIRRSLTKQNDVLQWLIEHAKTLPDRREMTPELLSYRVLLFNIASVITVAVAATHLLFDLYSMPECLAVISELRDEVSGVLNEEGGAWTREGLNKMVKLDSAIKESLRISNFSTRICARKVSEIIQVTFFSPILSESLSPSLFWLRCYCSQGHIQLHEN